MSEPPSFMLLQAADLPASGFPLFTASQFFAGLLLLLLSASFKAAVRAMEQSAIADRRAAMQRLAARLGQYIALAAGAVVLAAPAGSPGRAATALALISLLYLLLLLAGRLAATAAPSALLNAMSLPLRVWTFVAVPLVFLSYRADLWVQRRAGERAPASTEERLAAVIEASGLEGEESDLLIQALRFRERSVGELMVPRPDVVWLSTNDLPERTLQLLHQSGHSRFPLCLDSPDRVLGYVHVKDLGVLAGMPSSEQLLALARPVSFVPETAEALSVVRRFQRERSHMAVVVDEFGGTAGIVTLEDLLEELVGEIRDEFDDEEIDVTLLRNGEVLVDGSVRLDDLERGYGLSFGDVEEETVGGFVFGRLAREVSPGDEVDLEGAVLRVEDVEGLRVTRVRVIPASAVQSA